MITNVTLTPTLDWKGLKKYTMQKKIARNMQVTYMYCGLQVQWFYMILHVADTFSTGVVVVDVVTGTATVSALEEFPVVWVISERIFSEEM